MHERLQLLFRKHQDHHLSGEEAIELNRLLNDKNLEEEVLALLQESWEQHKGAEPMFAEPQSTDRVLALLSEQQKMVEAPHRRFAWRKLLAAASVLLIAGAGALLLQRPFSSQDVAPASVVQQRAPVEALPGGNRAFLKLADGRTILLDTAHKGSLVQQGGMQVLKNEEGQLSYLPAAGAEQESAAAASLINTVATPRGGQYRLTLGDGTRVWLNAATELRFPAAFTGNERLVKLSGEAYFEVEKDPSKPFLVSMTDGSVVEVLGTHFNIMNFANEGATKTTLLEGKIKLTADGQSKVLKPGDQVTRTTEGRLLLSEGVNTEEVLAWKKGLFDFSNASLQTIARQLERWYGVDISLEGKIGTSHISGVISRDNNLSTVLKMLEFTAGIRSRMDGTKLILYKNNE